MDKRRGFTMIEVLVVVAIMGILMLMAIPSLKPVLEYDDRNKVESMKNIIIDAIDYWSKDNIEPGQKPSGFYARNSQNRTVSDYIMNKELFIQTNLELDNSGVVKQKDVEDSKTIRVTFNKGVLNLLLIKDGVENNDISAVFYVSEETGGQIKDYDVKINKHIIIEGDEYDLRDSYKYEAIDVTK